MGGSQSSPYGDHVKTYQTPKELEEEFHKGYKSGLVLLEFWAPWSYPSTCMQVPYSEVASDPEFKNIQFVAVEFNKFKNLGEKLGVDAMPMFLLINGGKVEDRFVSLTKDELTEKLREKLAIRDPKVNNNDGKD